MTKHKSVLAVLLAVMMIFTFMPTLAFAAEGEVEAFGATELKAVSVTTDDTTEAIQYDSLYDALDATDTSANDGKNPVITLNEDVELTSRFTVDYPLTIVLNGKEITGIDNLRPTAGTRDKNYSGICRNDTATAITFAKHNKETFTKVYTWEHFDGLNPAEGEADWKVVAETTVCDNCGSQNQGVTSQKTTTVRVDSETNEYVYEYGDSTKVSAEKRVPIPEAAKYILKEGPAIVKVNNVNQHKDGLPVVKATLTEVATGGTVDATVTVTAATTDEITAWNKDHSTNLKNIPATCVTKGTVVYKAVAADPDGKVVTTVLLSDNSAVDETDHAKGAFKGIELVVKHGPYATAEDAADYVAEHKIEALDITEEAEGEFYYWAWSGNVQEPGENTKTTNTAYTVNLAGATNKNGEFTYRPVYFCNYDYLDQHDATVVLNGEPVKVQPLAAATTKAQNDAKDDYQYPKYSSCTQYRYAPAVIDYKFNYNGQAVQTERKSVAGFTNVDKAETTHKGTNQSGTDKTVDPTCTEDGYRLVICDICGDHDDNTKVIIPATGAHTFGVYEAGTAGQDVTVKNGVTGKLSADKKTVVVDATCTTDGGTYKYCTGKNNNNTPHWELDESTVVKATGHTPSNIVTNGVWNRGDGLENEDDAQYFAETVCSKCNTPCIVLFHSKDGKDTSSYSTFIRYNAIDVVAEEKGKDCVTNAKTTYTVKDMKNTAGKAITKSVERENTKGDHVFDIDNWNWSKDYEKATVSAKCKVETCPYHTTETAANATVTKETAASGETTYKATYGNSVDIKKVYTLKDAKVEFDATKITDVNLIPTGDDQTTGVDGVAPETPDVTVTLNGTVIDNANLTFKWTKTVSTTGNTVKVTASWKTDALPEGAVKTSDSAESKTVNVAAKQTFTGLTTVVKYDGKVAAKMKEEYDPAKSFEVTATATGVKGATVKYAVVDTEVVATEDKTQLENIEALNFDKDSVEGIKEVGKYFVYAQASKDGYTTYTSPSAIASLEITTATLVVSIDNTSVKQGETPVFNMIVKQGDKVVDIPQSEFVITTAGGQKLEELLPGDYKLLVVSKSGNYVVYEDTTYPGRTNTLTVLTKEGKTADQEAADVAQAADYALADANALVKSKYTTASYKKVVAAKDALKAAILNGTTQDVKEATATLEKAVKNVKTKKTNPMTVKTKTVKAKTNKTVTKKTGLIVKKAKGTKTYTKVSGNSKITVNSKTGKFTVKKGLKAGTYKVKVKVRAAGNGTYKAKTVKKTVKVKVS